jgi:hypothetical protein
VHRDDAHSSAQERRGACNTPYFAWGIPRRRLPLESKASTPPEHSDVSCNTHFAPSHTNLPGDYLATWEGANNVLTSLDDNMRGYILLETIVSASLVALIGAGLWQLVVATRHLTSHSSSYNEPRCETPQCSQGAKTIRCSCGDSVFAILP